jgi:hypothetical protein
MQVNELQSKMSRFHGLTAANPERKTIANIVTDGCESLKWQVREVFACAVLQAYMFSQFKQCCNLMQVC